MKRTTLLNAPLSAAIARLGHTDVLLVSDAGLPIPAEVERIDLALVAGVPTMMQTLRAISRNSRWRRRTSRTSNRKSPPKFAAELAAFLESEGVELRTMSHIEFKAKSRIARAAVRTADFTPYANIMLQAGVGLRPRRGRPAPRPRRSRVARQARIMSSAEYNVPSSELKEEEATCRTTGATALLER